MAKGKKGCGHEGKESMAYERMEEKKMGGKGKKAPPFGKGKKK
jgi:hypothetical protein